VLKGSFGLSPKGKRLRNTLISIQFIASFALIIGTLFMYLQNYFMQNTSLGYDKDRLITVNTGMIQKDRDALINQLKMYSGIDDVTYGESLLSSSDSYMGWGRQYNGEQISFQSLPVHHDFLSVMGIEITEGRDFRREDANMQSEARLFSTKQRVECTIWK
jgi:putative ABC transport system permease protein